MRLRQSSCLSFAAALLFLTSLGRVPSALAAAPGAPVITAVAPRGLGLLVSWVPADASQEIVSYSLLAAATPAAGVTIPPGCGAPAPTVVIGTDSAGVVGGLCAAVAYRVTISATNTDGTGPTSDASTPVVALAATAPSAPTIVALRERENRLIVAWVPPSDDGGKPITGYQLTASTGKKSVSVSASQDDGSKSIDGLINNKSYSLSVTATNAVGTSSPATASGKPHPATKPRSPEDVTVTPLGPGALSVSWLPPTDDGGSSIIAYEVSAREVIQKLDPRTKQVIWKARGSRVRQRIPAPPATIQGLDTSKRYQVTIRARNGHGYGSATPPNGPILPTMELKPEAVRLSPAALDALTSYSAGTLTWLPPIPAEVTALSVGQVLVGGAGSATPNGLLARIVSIDTPGGSYVLITTPASVVDAFARLSFATSVNSADFARSTLRARAPGIRTTERKVNFDTTIAPDAKTVSLDLSLGGDAAGLSFKNSFSFAPTLYLTFMLDGTNAYFYANGQVDIRITSSITAYGRVNYRYPLPDFSPPGVPLGATGLMLCPEIPLFLDVSLTNKVGIKIESHLRPSVSGWWDSEQIADFDNPFDLHLHGNMGADAPELHPTVLAEAVARVGIRADVTTLIGECPAPGEGRIGTGPGLSLTGGLKFKIDPTTPPTKPWLTADGFLSADADWKFEFLGSKTFRAKLEEADFPPHFEVDTPVPSAPTLAPREATLEAGQSLQFDATDSSGPITPSWSLEGATNGDAISPGGMLSVSGPPYRVLTLDASNDYGTDSALIQVADANGRVGLTPATRLLAARDNSDRRVGHVSWTAPEYTGAAPVDHYTVMTIPPTVITTAAGSATSAIVSAWIPMRAMASSSLRPL